ncbi:DUF4169 family protein [Brevundimonas aurifodinae]|uniref:DUF4169 family protein n=2 Tax=Brevundimonas TaxID=41275 RepID=A0ABV1NKT8_9CAUL|nr:MAG: hypothetical protein B7Z42_05305 [Brevundimonas sp. 12-68-7]OYX34626.1 MAG: hypothetical protein B7Z01_05545 [Brevundimonas subvibrioides]
MGEIINLNHARKARDKAAAKDAASVNRVAHGRTKTERKAAESEKARAARLLDQARREDRDD